jgi:hypothetical protein
MPEELNHKACVDLLMNEYGVSKAHRSEIMNEVKRIWDAVRMPHFVIIRSIRGFAPMSVTRPLETVLQRHQTHPPKHKKGSPEYRPGQKRDHREPNYERENDEAFQNYERRTDRSRR